MCFLTNKNENSDVFVSTAAKSHQQLNIEDDVFDEECLLSIRCICLHTHALSLSVDQQLKTESIAGSDDPKKTKQQQ